MLIKSWSQVFWLCSLSLNIRVHIYTLIKKIKFIDEKIILNQENKKKNK